MEGVMALACCCGSFLMLTCLCHLLSPPAGAFPAPMSVQRRFRIHNASLTPRPVDPRAGKQLRPGLKPAGM